MFFTENAHPLFPTKIYLISAISTQINPGRVAVKYMPLMMSRTISAGLFSSKIELQRERYHLMSYLKTICENHKK
jgi:hypothetical protein